MSEISPELVERMVALVRRCANASRTSAEQTEIGAEARSMLKELPEPDLIEARGFFIKRHGHDVSDQFATYARQGAYDKDEEMQLWLSAIKRGRELERANA
jgi:hypothetical protein